MAPLQPVKQGQAGKTVEAILDIANECSSLLQSRNVLPPNLEAKLEETVKRSFPVPLSSTLVGEISKLDSLGCELWNAATNILRAEETPGDLRTRQDGSPRLVVLLRVFAYFLIDTAQQACSSRAKSYDQLTRNFKVGLKACRFCLDKRDINLAIKILERCADHVSGIEAESPLVHITNDENRIENRAELKKLTTEFFLLRMTHAWMSERLDLAEHFFNKLSTSQLANSADLSERAADLFHEAGKSLFKKKLVEPALRWLERALSALNTHDIEHTSADAGELRLAVVASLVEILLSTQIADSVDRAQALVEQLSAEYGFGNRMTVHLMQLKIILAKQPLNDEELHNTLSVMLRSAVLTEQTFKIIMQCIHRIRKVSCEAACRGLEELITIRLLPDSSAVRESDDPIQAWMEKSAVTYALLATNTPDAGRNFAVGGLESILDAIAQRNTIDVFSAKATHAMQTLIWKAAGSTHSDIEQKWCGLLRHPLFDSAGQGNKARIGRKVMAIALGKDDINAAREAFFQMPAAAQNERLTRYLAFKLALRSDDYAFAQESLSVITTHADRDPTFLYACVLEAQQSQMRHIALTALQAILDTQPPGMHLPSLLRCTVRLLVGELEAPERSLDEIVEESLRLFEHAAANKQTLRESSNDQWRAEIQWWTKNAYNLALRLCGQIHPGQLIRLLQVCIKFIASFPDDAGLMHQDELKSRELICHFLSASAFVVLGRSANEGSEESLQCYLRARQEIQAFDAIQEQLPERRHDKTSRSRSFELLKFDLECLLNLHQWDDLDAALQACLEIKDVDRWDSLADIVLIIHRQTGSIGLDTPANAHLTELLQRIINETWVKDKDLVKASRWLRLAFSLDLSEGSGDFALKLLAQAASMARKGFERENKDEVFPETELQWLATTSFNKAVDLLSSGLSESSTSWIEGALQLARYAADNGALHANLTYKREQAMLRAKASAV